jgi:hypothetical protein
VLSPLPESWDISDDCDGVLVDSEPWPY